MAQATPIKNKAAGRTIHRGNSRIAENRKASFNYFLEDRYETGVVLQGWEVKAIRAGKVQITEGYVVLRDGEVFLIGCFIQPMRSTSTHHSAVADRTKKLLLHKDEIRRLVGKVERKGYTLVPLHLFWKNGRVKCTIALAKGKAQFDKRNAVQDRESKRTVERALKQRIRS